MSSYFKSLIAMFQILTSWALDPIRQAITSEVPIFKKGITDVKSKASQASLLNQMLSLTGIAQDKKRLKSILSEIIVSITYPAKSYAVITSDNQLYQKVKAPFSFLMNMGTQTFINYAQSIHDLILPLVDAMAEAGIAITTEDMETLQLAINTFIAASNSPVASIQDRKAANEQINKLVKEANDICRQILDENIVSFKPISEQYVADYKIKRQIIIKNIHTRLNANAVNELGVPYYNVTVTVNELKKDNKTYKAVSGTTDLDGNTIVSTFEPGVRTVTVSGPGIISKTFGPFKFEHGKEVIKTFTLAPAFNVPASKAAAKKETVIK